MASFLIARWLRGPRAWEEESESGGVIKRIRRKILIIQMCYTLKRQGARMTKLELAFSEIEKLPPAEQKIFAEWILEELHSEERWSRLFAKSGDMLSQIANEALTEHKGKKTKKLDPEAL
jgi:hypothetical protein